MVTKTCNTCEKPKDESEFYTGAARCKRCTLDRQKQLKEAKASGVKAPAERKTRKVAKKKGSKRSAPQAPSAALSIPAALGFSVSLRVDENTGLDDVVIEQTVGEAASAIWLSQAEAKQLQNWLKETLAS